MDETTQQTTAATDAASAAERAPSPGAAPTITVELFAGAAAEYGAETTTVRGATLQDALDDLLTAASPRAAQVIGRSSFLVGGVACTDRDRALSEGDHLDVLPPFAGG